MTAIPIHRQPHVVPFLLAVLVFAPLPAHADSTRWASGVVSFSSQYTSAGWSASQALGSPDTWPRYGDYATAWASLDPDIASGLEYLELSFDDPAPIEYIAAFETFNPGAIDSVYVWNGGAGRYDLVWSGAASPAPAVARLWSTKFALTAYPVSRIRLVLNSAAVPGWNEIDAVAIGTGNLHLIADRWPNTAAASSEYSNTENSATEATGLPDVYPNYGDDASAWASLTPDGQREWLQVSYSYPAPISVVDVYETYAPGAIDSIYVRNQADGSLHLVYASPPVAGPAVATLLHVTFPQTPYPVDGVRLTLASDAVPDWNEIDAVAIGADTSITLPGATTGVANAAAPPLPNTLERARPDPFRESTEVAFTLAQAGVVRLEVFDVRGARVATLARGRFEPGRHTLAWNGNDDGDRASAPGLYVLRLEAGGMRATCRVVRIR